MARDQPEGMASREGMVIGRRGVMQVLVVGLVMRLRARLIGEA
jgi:hypothetical protein